MRPVHGQLQPVLHKGHGEIHFGQQNGLAAQGVLVREPRDAGVAEHKIHAAVAPGRGVEDPVAAVDPHVVQCV